jgi:hypothetical protein
VHFKVKMYTEIKYIAPQFDTSVSTLLRTDTTTYYNFDKGGFNTNSEEDKLSILQKIHLQKNEKYNQMNFYNISDSSQFNVQPKKDTETDYFLKYIFDPLFDTNYLKKNVSVNSLDKKKYIHKSVKPDPVKTHTEQTTLKHIKNNNDFYKESKDWIIILLLFVLFIISWLRLAYFKSLHQILKSAYNFQFSQKYYRERNTISVRVSLILNVISILNLSLFMYFAFNYLNIFLFEFKGVIYYLMLCVILSLIYIGKYLIYKGLGWLLLFQKYFSEYLYNFFIYQKILGVLILPFIIGIPFMPVVFLPGLINISLILILFFLIIRTLRGIILSFKLKVSILYIFLYLCALEILPILIFLKLIILNR